MPRDFTSHFRIWCLLLRIMRYERAFSTLHVPTSPTSKIHFARARGLSHPALILLPYLRSSISSVRQYAAAAGRLRVSRSKRAGFKTKRRAAHFSSFGAYYSVPCDPPPMSALFLWSPGLSFSPERLCHLPVRPFSPFRCAPFASPGLPRRTH